MQMADEHHRRYKELTSAAMQDSDKWVHVHVLDGEQRAFTNLREAYMPMARKRVGGGAKNIK